MTVSTPTSPNVPAGWYPDPSINGHLRWWSGQGWTSHIRDAAAPLPQPGGDLLLPKRSTLGNRALGWGIVAMLCNALLLPSALAIVYGALALHHASQLQRAGQTPPSTTHARVGLVLGIVGAAGAIALAVVIQLWLGSSRG